MNRLPPAAALIFDLDGTLLDTEPLYSKAAQKVLDPFGHTYTLALKRRVMGGDSYRSAGLTVAEFGLPMTPDEFLAARSAHLENLFPDAEEIPGADAFLRRLQTPGRRLGLATGSSRRFCDLKTARRGWLPMFSAIVCGDDAELGPGKPAPDIFLLCAERLAVHPADAIAFEDSGNGIAAAKAAGMFVVAVQSPYTEPADLADADLRISNYLELLD